MTSPRLRFALFLGLIIVPAGVLTALSLRAVLDERGHALTDVRSRVPGLRTAFDERLSELVEGLATAADSLTAARDVDFVFRLDEQGRFVRPAILPSRLLDRTPDFIRSMAEGEEAEFGVQDSTAAALAYTRAVEAATSPHERAEALNALSRSWLAAGDDEQSEAARVLLAEHPAILDADGAHPLSLAILRRTLQLSQGDTAHVRQAAALVEGWVESLHSGRIPLHPGLRFELDRFAVALRRIDWHVPRPDLVASLQRLRRQDDFVATYDRLLETAVVRPEATYLSGVGQGGQTYVAALTPRADGAVGVLLDLDRASQDLLTSDAGQDLRDAGFGLTLVDAADVTGFQRRFDDGLRYMAPISQRVYRLNAGIYASDAPFVFAHYRNRSTLLVSGIALLASTIGLGLWVLLRETQREVDTARLRAEFVANVSHELRTPLTAIRMHAETLLLDRVRSEAQRRDYLETMMRESQRLSRMVGNVLDFSRLESGRKSFDFADVDVESLLRETLDEFKPVFDDQEFSVEVEIDASLPPLLADADALRTVVANLLSNAIKYSPTTRQILLRATTVADGVQLDVADRGIGIPEGERRRVFEKYRRADNIQGVATGTGLGLALVDAIARAHDGQAEALPREGGGTILRITIPTKRDPA